MSIPKKILLCAALATSTACATVETEGDGRDVVTTATIPAPPRFSALTISNERSWQSDAVRSETNVAHPSGCPHAP